MKAKKVFPHNRIQVAVLQDISFTDPNHRPFSGFLYSKKIPVTDMAFKFLEVYIEPTISKNYEISHRFLTKVEFTEKGRVDLTYRDSEVKRISFILGNQDEFRENQLQQVIKYINIRGGNAKIINQMAYTRRIIDKTPSRKTKALSTKRTATTMRSQKTQDPQNVKKRSPQVPIQEGKKPKQTFLGPRQQQNFTPEIKPQVRKKKRSSPQVPVSKSREVIYSPPQTPEVKQSIEQAPSDQLQLEDGLEELFGDCEMIMTGSFLPNNKTLFGLTVKEKEANLRKKNVDYVPGYLNFQSKGGINNSLPLDELLDQIDASAATRSEEMKEQSQQVQKQYSPERPPLGMASIEISDSPLSQVQSESCQAKEIAIEFQDDLFLPDEKQDLDFKPFIEQGLKYSSSKVKEYVFMEKQHAEMNPQNFQILGSTRFLNDNIIMSFLYYMSNHLISPAMRERIYICDSFLYQTLLQSSCPTGMDTFYKARNFCKREEQLFEKDFWFFPICKEQHWALAILCYPRKFFEPCENYDSKGGDAYLERPAFLVMDSIIGSNKVIRNLNYNKYYSPKAYSVEFGKIIGFMEMEYSVRNMIGKKQSTPEEVVKMVMPFYRNLSEIEFPLQKARIHFVDVPIQQNSYDCGIYLLQYVELFLHNPNFILNKTFQNLEDVEWFSYEMVQFKRQEIAKIFREVAEGRNPKYEYMPYFKSMEERFCYRPKPIV